MQSIRDMETDLDCRENAGRSCGYSGRFAVLGIVGMLACFVLASCGYCR